LFTGQSNIVDFHGIILFESFLRGWLQAKETGSLRISCIVLVGGKSERLGRDKALEPLVAGNLLERVLSRLGSFNSEIILVARPGQDLSRFSDFPGLSIVHDANPGKGPMGGLYTGLCTSTAPYSLVTAGDMPFLNINFLRYMVQLSPGFDVIVPRVKDYIEPLYAVYSRNCLKPIEDLLTQGDLQIRKLFKAVKVRYVEAAEIDRFDPGHLSFFNVNTEADLKKAREIIKSMDLEL